MEQVSEDTRINWVSFLSPSVGLWGCDNRACFFNCGIGMGKLFGLMHKFRPIRELCPFAKFLSGLRNLRSVRELDPINEVSSEYENKTYEPKA